MANAVNNFQKGSQVASVLIIDVDVMLMLMMMLMIMVMVMVLLQSSPRVAVEDEEEGNTLVVRGVTQLDEVLGIQILNHD